MVEVQGRHIVSVDEDKAYLTAGRPVAASCRRPLPCQALHHSGEPRHVLRDWNAESRPVYKAFH
jgi:hypothetical protein